MYPTRMRSMNYSIAILYISADSLRGLQYVGSAGVMLIKWTTSCIDVSDVVLSFLSVFQIDE